MFKFRKFLIWTLTISSIFMPLEICKAQENIEVISIIESTKGLDDKNISYPRWKQAELRFFEVIIPVGAKNPIHTHKAPMVVYVVKGKIRHTRGEIVNIFKRKEAFIESNNGGAHFIESIGKKPAILHVFAASAVGIPTTTNK